MALENKVVAHSGRKRKRNTFIFYNSEIASAHGLAARGLA
jgi:hypothetical protein